MFDKSRDHVEEKEYISSCDEEVTRYETSAQTSKETHLLDRHSSTILLKYSASAAFLATGIGLTICNSLALRVLAQPVQPNILIFAQQVMIVVSLGLSHLFGLVQLVAPKKPTKDFLLLILFFGCYVMTSMLAQSTLSVLLYVALRRTQVLFTVIIEYITIQTCISSSAMAAIAFMLTGAFTITGYDFFQGSAIGYVIVFACNCSGALYLMYVARLRANDSINLTFESALYMVSFSAVWVFTTSSNIMSELRPIMEPVVFCSVILAGAMNFSVIVNTRVNSPLTQSLCSVLKDALVMILSMIFMTDATVTSNNLVGCILIFCGAGLYIHDSGWKQIVFVSLFVSLFVSVLRLQSFDIKRLLVSQKKTTFSYGFYRGKSFGEIVEWKDQNTSNGLFHTYYHSDTTFEEFDMRNLLIVNAFSITQRNSSLLVVWMSGRIADYLEMFSSELLLSRAPVLFKYMDYQKLLRDTPIEDHAYFKQLSASSLGLPVQTWSDVIRNLLLYKYGGTWLDTDSWPIKDFSPLHSKYSHFIPSIDYVNVANNHVIHAARPRSIVTESVVHLMALCRYDRVADMFVRSPQVHPNWIYNDGVWDAVYKHQNQSNLDEKLVLLNMNAFDPWWKPGAANHEIFVIHARFPSQEKRDGIVSPQLRRFIDFLGTPLQAPTTHFNATDKWY